VRPVGRGPASSTKSKGAKRIALTSKRQKVAFPRPRPDGSIPPLHRTPKNRHASALIVGTGGGDGGGTGGGTGTSGSADTTYSDAGWTSETWSDSNYCETYDSNGDLTSQIYGSDANGFSVDIAYADGSQLTTDVPDYPGDPLGSTYTYDLSDGSITLEFAAEITNSATATYEDESGNTYTAPPVSVTFDTTSVGDFNFDGSGQSYQCQLLRLWESTVIAGIIVAGGYGTRYAPNVGAGTAAGIGTTTAALEAIRAAKETLAAHGCPTQ